MKHMIKIFLSILVCFSQSDCRKEKNIYEEQPVYSSDSTDIKQEGYTIPKCGINKNILINDSLYNHNIQLLQTYQNAGGCDPGIRIFEKDGHTTEIIADKLSITIKGSRNHYPYIVWNGQSLYFDSIPTVRLFLYAEFIGFSGDNATLKMGNYCFDLSSIKNELKTNSKIRIELISNCGGYIKQFIYE